MEGIRETQVEMTSPWMRNRATTAHHARKRLSPVGARVTVRLSGYSRVWLIGWAAPLLPWGTT